MIVVVLDGKSNFAFPDKSIQSHFVGAGADRVLFPALPRYGIGRVFRMARTRGRSLFVSRYGMTDSKKLVVVVVEVKSCVSMFTVIKPRVLHPDPTTAWVVGAKQPRFKTSSRITS
jgi:hypothetical protein